MALQDKTEPATAKKREEARENGQIAKSNDLNSALVLVVSLLILKAGGPFMIQGMSSILQDTFANLHRREVSADSLSILMESYAVRGAILCLPIMLGAGAVGLTANVLQIGFKFSGKAIRPDLTRIDPLKGVVRLVSFRALVELLKSVAKVCVIGYIVYAFFRAEAPALTKLAEMPLGDAGSVFAGLCWRMFIRAAVAVVIIAILDYMYQRIHFESSIRMTKQEVKDEFKRSEGDPQIKAQIRQRQREMARRRMIQEVPKADVVITNPTHLAVAIKYDPEEMAAPVVVAKGQRLMAEKIKAIAEAHRVPIVENKPVARLLYKAVEVGQQIPQELYQAVAEILAYVYRISQKAGRYRAA